MCTHPFKFCEGSGEVKWPLDRDSKAKNIFKELERDTKKCFFYLLYKLAVCSKFLYEH